MKVLTWNVNGVRGIGRRRLAMVLDAIASEDPDVLTLQEVSARNDLWPELRDGLRERGLLHAKFSGRPKAVSKKYGNVIASKYPVAIDGSKWAPGVPWKQLLARAVVDVPGIGAVDVLTAHIPNGSGNGWKKIETFEALAAYLAAADDMPRILTGDFNEPYRIDDGRMLSFGQRVRSGEPTLEGNLTRKSETHPRRRWDRAVLAVLDGNDLRHAHFGNSGRQLVCTHVTSKNERCFDHILVSQHFEIADSGYEHGWRKPGISDHSAAWVTLKPRR